MATSSDGGSRFLYFLVGGLIVAVAVLGYFYFTGANESNDINLKIEAPALEKK